MIIRNKTVLFKSFFWILVLILISQSTVYGPTCLLTDPIGLSEKKAMDFGQITVGFSGGTIDTAGTVTGDVVLFRGPTNGGQAGITACKGEIINYSFVNGSLTDGTNVMNLTITTAAGSQLIPNSGKFTLNVDGQLIVASVQGAGVYTGSYTIVVNY